MKIAAISDIHGNLPALEAALVQIKEQNVDLILGAGDWIGYGPFPGEVIERLKKERFICIRGNYDLKAVNARFNPERYKQRLKPAKWNVLNWTRKQLNNDHLKWIRNLPDTRVIEPVPGKTIGLFHGSPEGNEGRIYPSLTDRALNSMMNEPLPDILVAGHTHIPFVKKLTSCLVVNPGSTGQPVDGDPRPTYALIELSDNEPPSAQIVRFDYPLDTLLAAIQRAGLPDWLTRDFKSGKKRK